MGRKAAALALCIAAGPAQADFAADEFPPYERCALCHGLFGVSASAKFPNLGGQKASYLEAQIRAFLAGTRSNDGGQMSAVVTELKPEDIAVVVTWFATQDPPAPADAPPQPEGEAAFADLGCAGCHDNTPRAAADLPFLTAQHAGYLAKQMRDFRDGARDGTTVATMHKSLLSISDAVIDAMSGYLSGQARP